MHDLALAVGIDLGGTDIKCALVNDRGETLAWERRCTEKNKGPEHVLETISTLVEKLGAGEKGRPAVGVGVPGMLDASRRRIVFAPNLEWKDMELKTVLEERLGRPVWLENDANAAAVGEAWLGAGKGLDFFLLVTIGTGIGSGLVLNGRIYRGAGGLAPELGHMTLLPDGPKCGCGKRGCLEVLTCAPAILKHAQEAGVCTSEVEQVFDQARKGNQTALAVVREAMHYLAIGLANAIVMLDVEAVLIGGGVASSADVFLDFLREETLARLVVPRNIAIIQGRLGNRAGALGAARLAMLGGKGERGADVS